MPVLAVVVLGVTLLVNVVLFCLDRYVFKENIYTSLTSTCSISAVGTRRG